MILSAAATMHIQQESPDATAPNTLHTHLASLLYSPNMETHGECARVLGTQRLVGMQSWHSTKMLDRRPVTVCVARHETGR